MFKVVTDCATGETVHIPLTDQEIAEHDAAVARSIAENERAESERQAKEAAEAAAKASAMTKLYSLGLTSEEVAALIK